MKLIIVFDGKRVIPRIMDNSAQSNSNSIANMIPGNIVVPGGQNAKELLAAIEKFIAAEGIKL